MMWSYQNGANSVLKKIKVSSEERILQWIKTIFFLVCHSNNRVTADNQGEYNIAITYKLMLDSGTAP